MTSLPQIFENLVRDRWQLTGMLLVALLLWISGRIRQIPIEGLRRFRNAPWTLRLICGVPNQDQLTLIGTFMQFCALLMVALNIFLTILGWNYPIRNATCGLIFLVAMLANILVRVRE